MRSAKIKCRLKDLSAEVARLHRQTVPRAPSPIDRERQQRIEAIGRWTEGDYADGLLPPELQALQEYADVIRYVSKALDVSLPRVDPILPGTEHLVAVAPTSTAAPVLTPAAPSAPQRLIPKLF